MYWWTLKLKVYLSKQSELSVLFGCLKHSPVRFIKGDILRFLQTMSSSYVRAKRYVWASPQHAGGLAVLHDEDAGILWARTSSSEWQPPQKTTSTATVWSKSSRYGYGFFFIKILTAIFVPSKLIIFRL